MNTLVVFVDDMRYEQARYMPFVWGTLRAQGTLFPNARANVPICQAARIGFLTGQNADGPNNGVYSNNGGIGAADTENIGIYLQAQAVETAFIGKCPNIYRQVAARTGWDRWNVIVTGEQNPYGYGVSNGVTEEFPTTHEVIGLTSYVDAFIATAPEPWFVWWTPTQPHVNGVNFKNNPLPQDMNKFGWYQWPTVRMTDSSTRPTWIQNRPALTEGQFSTIRQAARQQLRELLGLDRAIQQVVEGMAPAVAADTLIMFVSDNGVFFGENNHNNAAGAGKDEPYDPATRVPLILNGPGVAAGGTNLTPTNPYQDIHKTLLDIYGATGSAPDGRSLLDPPDLTRATLYQCRVSTYVPKNPDSDAVFTLDRTLVRYISGTGDPVADFVTNPDDEYEMFDNDTDPYQQTNVANEAGRLTERNTLEGVLDGLLA